MRGTKLFLWTVSTLGGLVLLLADAPEASADVGTPGVGLGGEPGIGANGVGIGGVGGLTPAAAALFLCPGVGKAGSVILGVGGGYCDFNFMPVQLSATTYGVMHNHCEWGGAGPLVQMWNCWRVWPGQPDHPALPDPDIIPDGMGVPWGIAGPEPTDQWPPPGLAPAEALAAPPPEPPPPPPMLPPWGQPSNPPAP